MRIIIIICYCSQCNYMLLSTIVFQWCGGMTAHQRCTPALPRLTPAIVAAKCIAERASKSSASFTALHTTSITSSQSPSSLSLSITPSTFHSRLKTHLFHKSFPLSSLLFLPDWLHGSGTCTELNGHWRLFVLVSSFILFCFSPRVLD